MSFGGGAPAPPALPPEPEPIDEEAVKAEESRKLAAAALLKKGKSSTRVAGAKGLLNLDAAESGTTTTLGG